MKKLSTLVIAILIFFTSCKEISNNVEKPEEKEDLISNQSRDIRLCTEKIEMDTMSVFVYQEDRVSNFFSQDIELFNDLSKAESPYERLQDPQFSAIYMPYKWSRSQLTVSFIGGTLKQRNRVIQTTKQWEEVGNVDFTFGSFKNPDISISFRSGEGSWSYIGKISKNYYPSMNFGWLKDNSPQGEYDRVVLHEFGHALGFIHEHQHPDGGIPWNEQAVYEYYRRLGWEDKQIERNVFRKYERTNLNYTAFDRLSIMLYAISPELTDGNYSTDWNRKISPLDSTLVNIVYP